MKDSTNILHPSFSLNGLYFESVEELLEFAAELAEEGDEHEVSMARFLQKWFNDDPILLVKTSGATGHQKKISLAKEAMINSARATGTYFKMGEKSSALLCLHPKYIAGKMMIVRAMVLGWQLHVVAPEKDALTQYDNDYDFVAMVPYQVLHSIDALSKVKKLIIGGGPISRELEEKLEDVPAEVFASYGMTETCTHIAIRRLNGPAATNVFSALPDVTFTIDSRGCLVIDAPGLSEEEIITNDLIELITPTSFRWLGRYDNLINSGGVKIFPESVERKLTSRIDLPFIIASEKDELLGERVILIIEKGGEGNLPNYSEAFSELEPYERPKKVYTISKFPYTQTGKIKRGDVKQLLQKYR